LEDIVRATKLSGNLLVKAYAGSTGVLVAMDLPASARKGLLGFAIERSGGGEDRWLNGQLHFEGTALPPGEPVPTNLAPIQKFRWSDYTVWPDTTYRYRVHPVYGRVDRQEIRKGAEVEVTTQARGATHTVVFNRAAAASQAFSRKFPGVEAELEAARKKDIPNPQLPDDALEWLSRGLLEEVVEFIESAKGAGWALDVAIYEYELPRIVEAMRDAHRRGVEVRVVYHAKRGDPQTAENQSRLKSLPPGLKRARVTSAICHHKFIVLSKLGARGDRLPRAVLCGSTNFTENGVYRQANVVHVVQDRSAAATYLELFDVLFGGATPGETRKWINAHNPIQGSPPLFAGFSPRTRPDDLDAFVSLIGAAERDVLFCTAFNLVPAIEAALLGQPNDPILRFGIQNRRTQITGFHRDRTASFAAAAFFSKGLEGFLKESTAGQRGNILIHTKLIVIDFTSDSPIVISGSHNLSRPASHDNDENFLIVRTNPDVADCYGVELMRLYDHYRARWASRQNRSGPRLTTDDGWSARYYRRGSLNRADRLAFTGRPIAG
jgi:phosphatidylserine/phosphatidylglycerophosphate/cardiolipin synthase-like enzyme